MPAIIDDVNKSECRQTMPGWSAQLSLELGKSGGFSRLKRCAHSGPLYVQKPFYPEGRDWAHIYLLHPPAGLVSGDSLEVTIDVNEAAGALITTPGATRIYRSRDTQITQCKLQAQKISLNAKGNANIEWFPLETIVYDGAFASIETTITLESDCHFLGWEINCFGLAASNAPFVSGEFRQRYRIERNGTALFVEHIDINEQNLDVILHGSAAMRGEVVSGFSIFGPVCKSLIDKATMTGLRRLVAQHQLERAAISLVGEFVIGRYLGGSAAEAKQIFTAWWGLLRPLILKRAACPPRIWAT